MGVPEGNEPETGYAGARRSAGRVAFQLVRASIMVWVPVSLLALYLTRNTPAHFGDELGKVTFYVMFLAIVVGGWMVFSPQGETHQFLSSEWPWKYRSVSFIFPRGASSRDLTGQELSGGISPGTVALVVALELLAASLLLSH